MTDPDLHLDDLLTEVRADFPGALLTAVATGLFVAGFIAFCFVVAQVRI